MNVRYHLDYATAQDCAVPPPSCYFMKCHPDHTSISIQSSNKRRCTEKNVLPKSLYLQAIINLHCVMLLLNLRLQK